MSTSKHARHAGRRRPLALLAGLGAILVIATGTVWTAAKVLLEPQAATAPDDGTSRGQVKGVSATDCVPLTVVTPRSYQPVLARLADGMEEGAGCARLEVVVSDGRKAYDVVEEREAQVWITDDAAWYVLAEAEYDPTGGYGSAEAEGGEEHEEHEDHQVLATSPMVMLAPPAAAAQIRSGGGGWEALADAVAGAGLKVVTAPPQRDAGGLLGVAGVADAVWDRDGMDASAVLLGAVKGSSRTVSKPWQEALSLSEVGLVSERDLLKTAQSGSGLEVLTPSDVTTAARFTFYDETEGEATEAEAAAIQRLRQALAHGPERDAALAEAGLRRPDGSLPDGLVSPVDANLPPLRPVLEAHRIQHVLATWYSRDRAADVLVVIDVSGSMRAPVPGGTRPLIDVVRDQVRGVAGKLPNTATLGIWVFGTNLALGRDHLVLVPPAPLDAAHRAQVRSALASITVQDTGSALHDTVLAAYLAAQERVRPEVPSQVVVLTDGSNQDDPGSLTLDQLHVSLEEAVDPDRPVGLAIVKVGGPPVDLAEAVADIGGHVLPTQDLRGLVAAFTHLAAGGIH